MSLSAFLLSVLLGNLTQVSFFQSFHPISQIARDIKAFDQSGVVMLPLVQLFGKVVNGRTGSA